MQAIGDTGKPVDTGSSVWAGKKGVGYPILEGIEDADLSSARGLPVGLRDGPLQGVSGLPIREHKSRMLVPPVFLKNSIPAAPCVFRYIHAAFGGSVCPGDRRATSNSTWMGTRRWQTGKSGRSQALVENPVAESYDVLQLCQQRPRLEGGRGSGRFGQRWPENRKTDCRRGQRARAGTDAGLERSCAVFCR